MKKEQTTEMLIPSYKQDENITIQQEPIKHNFIIVYDTIYKNYDLNANEIALLIYLISASPTFKPNKNGIIKSLKLTRREYEATIKTLKEKGYLKINQIGKHEYKYIVNQTPQLTDRQLTYDYLSRFETANTDLWNTLLKNKSISYETYNELWENLIKIARYKWTNKKD